MRKLVFITWDDLHKEVEAWASDKLGGHLGALDPQTLEFYKKAVFERLLGL